MHAPGGLATSGTLENGGATNALSRSRRGIRDPVHRPGGVVLVADHPETMDDETMTSDEIRQDALEYLSQALGTDAIRHLVTLSRDDATGPCGIAQPTPPVHWLAGHTVESRVIPASHESEWMRANLHAFESIEQKAVLPESLRLTDPRFVYVPAAATDVQATWRRFGWRPKRECD